MGGTIEVESAPGQGSTFRFSINLAAAAVEPCAERQDPAAPAFGRRLNILLAEDNATNRHVATRMLTRMGHDVRAVEDGAKAIAAVAETDYDVILMDMMMPEVDGITATRAIRSGPPPGRDTPIIGLTANALASDRAACEAAGMNDFVTKPVTLERLRTALMQSTFRESKIMSPAVTAESVVLDEVFLDRLAEDIGADGVAEMLRVFQEDAPARMAAIRLAMANRAIQTIRLEAHALLGAARNVGLTKLGEAAAALQKTSEKSGADSACIEAFADTLRDSLAAAAAWAEAHQFVTETTA
jgi:CheY-like chemotaxis protein